MTAANEARKREHDRAQREGLDGYLDPVNGLFVMTEAYLLARGTCCQSNCRHCPYRSMSDSSSTGC